MTFWGIQFSKYPWKFMLGQGVWPRIHRNEIILLGPQPRALSAALLTLGLLALTDKTCSSECLRDRTTGKTGDENFYSRICRIFCLSFIIWKTSFIVIWYTHLCMWVCLYVWNGNQKFTKVTAQWAICSDISYFILFHFLKKSLIITS